MSVPMVYRPADGSGIGLPLRVAALALLGLAVALQRLLPLRAVLAIAHTVKRPRRPTRRQSVERYVTAAAWAGDRFPGRAACLEQSLTAYLLCSLHGWNVDWCIGCRFDPAAAHAWIEAEHQPVGEPDVPDRPLHTTVRS
ncbi:lasso peptide biosynthesis B2 protein [Streptomyces monticola]|uniref:Lasso peptide biosynthesis B2 protein n=1 Tax=Streptomyces monticola TaxID=2666263 RepID=A0ABW2JS04_9ACTN